MATQTVAERKTVSDVISAQAAQHRGYDDGDAIGLVNRLGLQNFAYLSARLPAGSSLQPEETFCTSYDRNWLDRYIDKKYRLYDPVVELAMRSRFPFFWGHGGFLKPFRKSQKLVFHEAKEFGITEGFAVPVFGPEGDVGVFTVVADNRQDVRDAVANHAAEIELFAARFHNARIDELDDDSRFGKVELTPRERECLVWASEGLTTEAIADRLGITVSAVNYHFGNVSRKLGASNKHHAAIIALSHGML